MKEFAEKHKTGAAGANGGTVGGGGTTASPTQNATQTSGAPQQQQQPQTGTPQIVMTTGGGGTAVATHTGIKSGSPAPVLSSAPTSLGSYPISQTLETTNPGPVAWASSQQGRPTMTGGMASGRMSGAWVHCLYITFLTIS